MDDCCPSSNLTEDIIVSLKGHGGLVGLFISECDAINAYLKQYNRRGYAMVGFEQPVSLSISFRLLQFICLLVTLLLWCPVPGGVLHFRAFEKSKRKGNEKTVLTFEPRAARLSSAESIRSLEAGAAVPGLSRKHYFFIFVGVSALIVQAAIFIVAFQTDLANAPPDEPKPAEAPPTETQPVASLSAGNGAAEPASQKGQSAAASTGAPSSAEKATPLSETSPAAHPPNPSQKEIGQDTVLESVLMEPPGTGISELDVPDIGTSVPTDAQEEQSSKHNNLGMKFYSAGDYPRAIYEFIQALTVNPADHRARYNLSCTFVLYGEVDKALDLLQQFKDADCDVCRGRLERAKKDKDFETIREMDRFRSLVEPQTGKSKSIAKGGSIQPSGRLRPQADSADVTFEDKKNGGWGWWERCDQHLRAEKLSQALYACQQGLANATSTRAKAALLFNLGKIYDVINELILAEDFYKRSLVVVPGNKAVKRRLFALRERKKNH